MKQDPVVSLAVGKVGAMLRSQVNAFGDQRSLLEELERYSAESQATMAVAAVVLERALETGLDGDTIGGLEDG